MSRISPAIMQEASTEFRMKALQAGKRGKKDMEDT